ncbi:unnamed protein product [Plutella xylostella]|uniref:(diamondback moth) hypothetical protein n=1 Tax=Plutella xylostella TaxID=51655 RepID=A0A8S4ECW9_PLUXY|nr:unnamed protein product [Plutella xylostella]
MGSKKHKKESKKKKHRSRSRSPLDTEEKERKRHHKKHKDRKKDRSPDVEEVPLDSHLQDNGSERRSSSAERERDRRKRDERTRERDDRDRSVEAAPPSPPAAASTNQESLSIEETNRLRAKLGLKPLEAAEKPTEDGKFKDDLGEFYHAPAANIAQQKKSEKIREKLNERKEKRLIEQKLQTAALGAAGSDDEDAAAWVRKSREIQKQKQEAAKRAAMLDEMDEVFGVSELVAAETRADRAASYTPASLRGLRVAHDLDALGEENEVVLTLADKEVLAEDAEDVLVNVNIVDDEKYKKNLVERKKAKTGYKAYDDDEDMEALALGYSKPVLAKYDEEIDQGKKASKEKGFVIGDEDGLEALKFKQAMMRERLSRPDRILESLAMPAPRLASAYYDEQEMQAKFKKVKRKGKHRKRAKQEPIDVDDYDPNAAPLETDDTDVKPELLKKELEVDEDEVEPDGELQTALARARRLRQAQRPALPKVEDILSAVKEEPLPEPEPGSSMTLDATAEFCRTLGDIPTYGQAGNRDVKTDIMDFEREEMEIEESIEEDAGAGGAWSRVDVHSDQPPDIAAGCVEEESGAGGAWSRVDVHSDQPPDIAAGCVEEESGAGGAWSRVDVHSDQPPDIAAGMSFTGCVEEESGAGGAWSRVDVHSDQPPDIAAGSSVALDAEPALGCGVAGALQLALSKGYLERAPAAPAPRAAPRAALHAASYSIEDKSIGDDDKHSRRERGGYSGPLQDFREKAFKPNIKLEYVDDDGRPLCPKEAFRYLSHKFHGKGPGKNKQEKRIKKAVQEGLMKKMSSTDTPLNTLALLQEKQKETHSAYIVLSGAKKDPPA